MLKIALSGGPHSGKTTTMEALRAEYPEAYFVEEAAECVIERELGKQKKNPDYEPIMPVTHYPIFQPLVLKKAVELEQAIPEDKDVVFLDRSLVDHIGYCRLNNLEERVPEIESHIEVANYAFAFFCEPVGEYQQTAVRREDPEQAKATHDQISLAYDLSEVPVVHLPAVTVQERLQIIAQTIETHRS